MSGIKSNPFASVPCANWRALASTGRLKADPETGETTSASIREAGRFIGGKGLLVWALPPVFRVAGIPKAWADQASKLELIAEGFRRLFFAKANIYELKGGILDGRGALANGERGNQLDELEQFARANGGSKDGEVRVTRKLVAAWQESHFAKHQAPISDSDKKFRRIELTLPFFLFSRTDGNFADGADYVTIKDVRKFWDPQNPDFPPDFDSIKADLSFKGLFAASKARKKLAGLPDSAQSAVGGPGTAPSAAKNLNRAVIRD